MTDLSQLIERIEARREHRKLRFGVFPEGGWVISDSEPVVRVLCDMWNNRATIAAALRALQSGKDEG